MPLFAQRRTRRGPLGCVFAAIIVFALGLAGIVVVAVLVIGAAQDAPESGGVDPAPGSSTTAPVTGGWSSGG